MFNLPKVYIDNVCNDSVSSAVAFFLNLLRFNEMEYFYRVKRQKKKM